MSKIVTLRLDETLYDRLKKLAEAENRPLSNYIITAAKKFVEESIFASDEEMAEILSDKVLMGRIKKGSRQVKARKGRLIG
ncbi:MAG: CopG family transcriptional regulator [Actinomycetota bacterium]|nr:CopG family transcriptional regulator [Actinomycetota bacterium]MDI6822731.1 CopG family transcriptional regulator [Actinomycetota bacterium]